MGRQVGSWVGAGIKLFGGVAVVTMSTVPAHVWANPTGEQVVGGAASFNRPDAATLIVNQQTDRAVINWNSFSIANGELTRFVQPSSTSAALNRVVTANPSQIYGTLQANGQVYLINPGGVMVGPGGVVDVAGFVASTHDIANEEFMRGGNLNFHGTSEASILTQGRVEAREGDVFLVAREVKNEGQLMARDGTVGMVSGTEVSLQAVGQGNYKIRLLAAENDPTAVGGGRREAGGEAEIVNEGVIQAANAVLEAKGSYLPMAIKNTGLIEATGVRENGDGTVSLTGGEGDILNTGVVAALQRSLDGQKETGGSIFMAGKNVTSDPGSIITAAGRDGGGTVKLRSADTTELRGDISVVGKSESAKGGQVQLLGERVGLFERAKVDASGGAGGGEVLVGGDYLGLNPDVPNAKATVMGSEAKIIADATVDGDGGRVILWSDEYTGFYGDISARGGLQGGDGGLVETSSKINLQAFGGADASAENGQGGLWLLDPTNVEITAATNANPAVYVNPWVPTGATSQISATDIVAQLNGGTSVEIQTSGANGQAGNITMTAGINKDATVAGTASTLTMIAAGSINISQPITSVDGALSLVLGAASGVTVSSTISTLGGSITIQGANPATGALPLTAQTTIVTLNSGANISTLGGSGSGNLSITATGAITQNVGSTLNIKGTTSVTTGGAAITLSQASNDFNGAVSLTNTGNNAVAVTDADALTLGTLNLGGGLTVISTGALNLGQGTVGGNLAATSNGGAINQAAGLTVTGTSNINAGAATITLTQAANNFTGAVTLSNTGANAVAITDANDLTLGTLAVGGNLTVTSNTGSAGLGLNLGQGSVGGSLTATSNNNPITQSGALSVTGLTTINAGTSSINLPGPGNAFTGGVLLTAGTITAFQNSVSTTLTPAGDITIGNITIPGGTLSVTAGGSITINGNISVTSGTVILSAGNATTSPASGQIILSGTPTITASRIAFTGYTVGLPTQPILTIGNGGSITMAALASGGAASANADNRLNSNSGIFIANQGTATIGTVVDVAGFVSTGQGGIIFENNNNTIISSGISSNGGPVYIATTSGTVAVNSTVQASSNAPNPTLRATVGIYGDGGITDNADGAITATRLALASDNSDIVLDSGLHVVTQLAGDTGTTDGNFTFSGGSFYVGSGAYYLPGVTPGTGVVTPVTGIDAQQALTLTSSGDIVPVPATLTSSPVTVRAAGGAGIVARTLQGGAIRLDGANDSFGTVSLRSNSGTDLGAGNITYTEAAGDLALANLQTSGRATINFDGNLTQTGIIQVGTLNLQGTGSSGTGDDALLNLANQIGAIRGQIVGNLTLSDVGSSLFPGLVVGEEVNGFAIGLTSTTGNITLTTDGALTQVGGITATGGAGPPPIAGFLTVDALSITLDLAVAGISLNNVNQISLASTGGNTIYRDANGYYVQRAVAPNPNGATRGEGGAGFVSLAADSGIVRDDIAAALALTDTMSGDGLVLLSSGSANFDLQNFTTGTRTPYDFDSFAASGVGSDFYFRDTDYLVISTVNGTAGVSTGGDLVLTAGGDVTQDATISSNNLRVTIRSVGGNYLVLSGANDVTNVSLQTRTNAGGDDPDPNSGAAANGLIYFRDVDDFQIGVNIPIGIVNPGASVTGVVTLQGDLNTGVSNVVLESGTLSAVTQLANAGALVSTTGLGLIGGDFTIDQGTAPANPISAFDSANNVSFFAAQTLDNDILYREINGFTVNFVRMDFPVGGFQGGLNQADFQVNGIQAGNVILQVQAPTLFTQGQQGILLNFTGTRFGGNGQTLLSDFSTTDMLFDSPGYIESSGRVIITVGNSNGLGGATGIGRFTMDEGIHIITTVAGTEHDITQQGNRDIAILADNMVLGRDGNPGIVVDGLIQTPDIKTAPNPMETVTLAPFSNTRQLFVSSPKATLGDTSATGTQANPNQLELSTGELRRVNTDRLIIRSSFTDAVTQLPAVNVRSAVNLYGLYDDTFAALGVFPNNAGVNRFQIQAAGGNNSYAWAEAEISSDINQLPLQVFVVSANNPYTTPDVLPPVATLPTQGDRVVVSGGIRSYGGTVILRGQDATITGGINATAQGLVGIVPAVAGRAITLGTEPGASLSILRSELGLVTAGTVQIGSLVSTAMPAGIDNNPFYVNDFETVSAGAITITDLMSGLSADTLALVTDAGVDEQAQGGIVTPGLALIGGTTAGSNFLLDSGNNDVDRLAVYMADAGVVVTGDDPVQNVVYHDQNGFGGGNGFEVALVQQQAEQGLLRSTAIAGSIPLGTGLGLIRANQLSITAGGDVTVYDVIPTGGLTSTSYIGHVPTVPGTPVLVLGNLVNLLAIDASTPSPETGGVNEVFFSAANGLGIGDIGLNGTNLRGGVAGILTNGGNVSLEGNDIQIYTVNRATGDNINIDTTADGVAPDGARVVLRPSTGFNGFVNRPGAGAPVEILLGGAAPPVVPPVENVATLALDGILDLAEAEIGQAGIRASVLEIGSRSNPATAAGKIRVADHFNTFSPLLQVVHLLTGGAIEDVRATTGTLLTGLTINNLAAEANGSISLVGALNSIGTFAAESNFGQSEVRLFNTRATVLGTVDGVSGILASTFAAQLTAGGLTQTPGSSIEAGLLSINTSAGNGNVTLNSQNGVAQVAINAGTGNILLRTTGSTRIVSAAASQPGGVPVAVSGLTGTLITLYSGGDVTQDANAPITRGGPSTPTAVTVVTQNGFSITLDATENRLPANSVFAAVTSSGALGNLTNLTLVNGLNGGGLELGSGAVIDLSLTSAGSGYTGSTLLLDVAISAPAGVGGTTATGQVVAGVKTIAVSNGGAGYLSAPTVTIGGTGGAAAVAIVDSNPLSATYGQVTSIQITDPGTGYLALPTVTLSGGSPAQAAAVAATELQITGLVITNPGSRYDATPTVTITGTGGSGAAGTSTIGGTGGVYFAGGSSVSGGITGNLNIRNLSAVSGITQQTAGTAGAISVAGTTTLTDSSAAGISMGNNNNNLQGTITVTQSGGGNVAIGNNNSSVLGNITLSGGLGVQTLAVTSTGGSIYQFNSANVITAPGAASFLATANGLVTGTPVGSVILNNALNTFGGSVSAAGTRVVIRGSGALNLGAVTASTSLVATSTSAGITQSGVISSTGAASFAAAAGQTIDLSTQANTFGSTASFNSLTGAPLNSVLIRDTSALDLQALTVASNLSVNAAGITQSGALVVPGTLTLAGGAANNITLSNAANNFGTVVITSGNNVTLADAGGVILSGPSLVSGNLFLTAGGNITDANGTSLTVSGLATFNAGGFDITLGDNAGDTTNFGSLNLTGGAVTVTEDSAMVLAGVSATTLNLTATSGITQTGAVTVTGNSAFTANPGQSILLGNLGNNFTGTVTFTGNGGNLANVTLFDQSAITTQAGGLTIDGALTLTSLAGISFNNITAASLTATAAGNITDVNGTTLNIAGLATFNAGGFNITLGDNAGDTTNFGSLILSGGTVTVTEDSAMVLAGVSANALTLNTTAGITQTGAVVVAGDTSLTAAAGQSILLGSTGNNLAGGISFFGSGGNLGDITLYNNSAYSVQAGGLTIGGDLAVTAAGIGQQGALDVGGTTTLNGGTGAIVLANSGNAYGGTVSITGGASADMFFHIDDDEFVGSVVVDGAFTLRTNPTTPIELGGSAPGPFKLDSNQLGGFRVGTFSPVANNGSIFIPEAFNFSGIQNLSLTTQSSGIILANGAVSTGTLSLSSAGTATFNAVNSISSLGSVSIGAPGAGLTFQNNRGLSLSGAASMQGRLSLEVAGQFYNQTGSATPLAGVQGGSVVKSLSLAGGLPNLISGLAGFGVRYDGVMPTSGNVMSYAVSPLTMFAPNGTVIAGVDLSGTQTGGGQLNTFFTGSDNLNWMIADFGKFNLPKVEPARMEYMLYQQRVEPETRSLPQPVMRELTMELGRPPTIEELQAREVAKRQAVQMRSGAILERSSFDEDVEEPKQEAMGPVPILDGGKPQAGVNSESEKRNAETVVGGRLPEDGGRWSEVRGQLSESLKPQAKKQTDMRRDANGPILRSGPQRAVALRAEPVDAAQIIQAERERAEVGVAPPVAATPR